MKCTENLLKYILKSIQEWLGSGGQTENSGKLSTLGSASHVWTDVSAEFRIYSCTRPGANLKVK